MPVQLLRQQSKFIKRLQVLLDHTQLLENIYLLTQILEQQLLKVITMGQLQVEQVQVL